MPNSSSFRISVVLVLLCLLLTVEASLNDSGKRKRSEIGDTQDLPARSKNHYRKRSPQPQSSDGEPDLLQGELGWDWKERERWEAMLAQGSNMAFKKQQWRKVVESMGENQGIDVDKCLNGGLPTISPTDYMPHDSLLGTETESESPSAFSGDILPKDTNLDALTSGCHSKVLFGHGGLGIQDNAFEGDNALDYASFFRAASSKVQSNN